MGHRVILACALAIAGCHAVAPAAVAPPPPPAAPPIDAAPMPDAPLPLDRDPRALVDAELGLWEQVATAVATEGDCAARAAAIDGVATAAAPLIAARRSLITAGLADARAAELAAAHVRWAAAIDRIGAAAGPCGRDPIFERALDHVLTP
jgi:hypothetical protein